MIKKTERVLGAHMSISEGVDKSIDRGISIGCDAIQIFTGYNTRWQSKPLTANEIEQFHQKKDSLTMILAHNNYLINLASPDEEISRKSYDSMRGELQRAEQLKLPFLVIHPGSHTGSGEKKGIERISLCLNNLFAETSEYKVKILLETTAGQGTNLGYKFEHLACIMDTIHYADRIGVCFDTCHSFAAGYDLRTPDAYEQTFHEFDHIIGLSNLLAFHLNDSKHPFSSRKDRHEHIGKGFLGIQAFRLLLADERFATIPMILETPKSEDKSLKADTMNLETLQALLVS
ncbi:MAG: deoxyribonuclease IV [bacterium]